MLQKSKIIFVLILFHIPIDAEIEEIITTGSLIENSEIDSSPISLISADDYKNFNISSIAEISKYISSSSGSHFNDAAFKRGGGGVEVMYDADAGALSFRVNGGDESAKLFGFPVGVALRPWAFVWRQGDGVRIEGWR